MPKKLTKEEFIEKARKVHGDKYDYSEVEYVNNSIKVNIRCLHHGEFPKTPNKHLSGQGCPDCIDMSNRRNKRYTQEEFISKAVEAHNNKYDYSITIYNGIKNPIQYICKEHGIRRQIAYEHLHSSGCSKCANRSSDAETFIKKAMKIHKGCYTYDHVEYVSNSVDVLIYCKIHDKLFPQSPNSHLKGRGCSLCAMEKQVERQLVPQEEYMQKLKKIYGDKYDLSQVVYNGTKNSITVSCPKHGIWNPNAKDFSEGHGCPDCGIEARSGENHPNYIDGLSKERHYSRNSNHALKWSWAVRNRDKACDCCGIEFKKGNLRHAHHLESWVDNEDLRFDINNGISLCKKCHYLFHRSYGNGYNTKEQYIEFKELLYL